MELIDKSAIVAEIEKRIEEGNKWADAAAEKNLHNTLEANELVIGQYKSLLSFIHTLEVKDVDLKKEIENYLFAYGYVLMVCDSETAVYSIAKHFYELGLRIKENKK